MQSLFNRPPSSERGVIIPPTWSNVRQGLTRNLLLVTDYNRDRAFMTKNNHLLVRLIDTVRVNYEAQIERFYEQVDAQAVPVSTHFSLINEVSSTSNPENCFYGEGVKELILTHTQSFDIYEAYANWQDQTPVKVLWHPKTDLTMHVPTGVSYSDEQGVAVIAINIPMLMIMHRGFVHDQLRQMAKGQPPKPTSMFVRSYVLTNMLPSHLDLAIYNRLVAIATNTAPIPVKRTHPISLANWTPQADRALVEVIDHLRNAPLSLHDMLCNIPAVTSANAAEAMVMPTAAPTRQYAWSEVAARIPVVVSMALLSPSSLTTYDKASLQAVLRSVDTSGTRQVMKNKLGADATDVLTMLDVLTEVLGQKHYLKLKK